MRQKYLVVEEHNDHVDIGACSGAAAESCGFTCHFQQAYLRARVAAPSASGVPSLRHSYLEAQEKGISLVFMDDSSALATSTLSTASDAPVAIASGLSISPLDCLRHRPSPLLMEDDRIMSQYNTSGAAFYLHSKQ